MWRVKGEAEWVFHHIRADKMSLFTLSLISMHNDQSLNEYSYIRTLIITDGKLQLYRSSPLQGGAGVAGGVEPVPGGTGRKRRSLLVSNPELPLVCCSLLQLYAAF